MELHSRLRRFRRTLLRGLIVLVLVGAWVALAVLVVSIVPGDLRPLTLIAFLAGPFILATALGARRRKPAQRPRRPNRDLIG